MTDHEKFLSTVLDFGEALMGCGAEVSRIEDTLKRICTSYGYNGIQVLGISAGIMLAVALPNEKTHTQLRRCSSGGNNFSRLSALNALSREVCATTPPQEIFAQRLAEILKQLSFWK